MILLAQNLACALARAASPICFSFASSDRTSMA
jgi:hypothetical protein